MWSTDSVGILDRYFFWRTVFSRNSRGLIDMLKNCAVKVLPIEYVSICSPNYLHDAHNAVCASHRVRMPSVKNLWFSNPWNLDAPLGAWRGKRQENHNTHTPASRPSCAYWSPPRSLRHEKDLPENIKLSLTYITSRGDWYLVSWKGQLERFRRPCDGILEFIFSNLLIWLFGAVSIYPFSRGAHCEPKKNSRIYWGLNGRPVTMVPFLLTRNIFLGNTMIKTRQRIDPLPSMERMWNFPRVFANLHNKSIWRDPRWTWFRASKQLRPSIVLAHDIRVARC